MKNELVVFEIMDTDYYGEGFQFKNLHRYGFIEILHYNELYLNILFQKKYFLNYYHVDPYSAEPTVALGMSTERKKVIMLCKGHRDYIQIKRMITINEIIY